MAFVGIVAASAWRLMRRGKSSLAMAAFGLTLGFVATGTSEVATHMQRTLNSQRKSGLRNLGQLAQAQHFDLAAHSQQFPRQWRADDLKCLATANKQCQLGFTQWDARRWQDAERSFANSLFLTNSLQQIRPDTSKP